MPLATSGKITIANMIKIHIPAVRAFLRSASLKSNPVKVILINSKSAIKVKNRLLGVNETT